MNTTHQERDADVLRAEFEAMSILRKRFRLRDCGAGKWDALCPAHDDHNRSLRVYRGEDGRLRFRCYAGCHYNDVRDALGLRGYAGNGASARRAPVRQAPAVRRADPAEGRYNFPQLANLFACDARDLYPLAAELGVSVAALSDAGVGWADQYPMLVRGRGADGSDVEAPVSAWVWPMHDQTLTVCGLRMRPVAGRKYSFTGSRPGLFAGTRWLPDTPTIVVEGATDTAAGFDWGFNTLGRPSCDVGDDEVCHVVGEVGRGQDVIVFAQVDEAKYRTNGTVFYPGQESAVRLADRLTRVNRGVKIITAPPGFKDARAWLRHGATAADVRRMIASKNYHRRTR